MNEKPVAGLVTTAVVAPLVAVCCLGPAAFGSILGGVAGWLGGLNAAAVAGPALAAGLVAYGFFRWRGARLRREEGQQSSGPVGRPRTPSDRPHATAPTLPEPFSSRQMDGRGPHRNVLGP